MGRKRDLGKGDETMRDSTRGTISTRFLKRRRSTFPPFPRPPSAEEEEEHGGGCGGGDDGGGCASFSAAAEVSPEETAPPRRLCDRSTIFVETTTKKKNKDGGEVAETRDGLPRSPFPPFLSLCRFRDVVFCITVVYTLLCL